MLIKIKGRRTREEEEEEEEEEGEEEEEEASTYAGASFDPINGNLAHLFFFNL